MAKAGYKGFETYDDAKDDSNAETSQNSKRGRAAWTDKGPEKASDWHADAYKTPRVSEDVQTQKRTPQFGIAKWVSSHITGDSDDNSVSGPVDESGNQVFSIEAGYRRRGTDAGGHGA
ncbi:hypothetical protein diail_4919 [Diaporthe ilicicola]|nr:hypothetical protein diail_4919 [Diaporthe ilicicola]